MVNTKIRLIIFFAAKDGEALYSQQKQDRELSVAQIMNSLLPRKRSHSVVSDSLRPHGLQPTRILCPWDFPGKSTGVVAISFSSLIAKFRLKLKKVGKTKRLCRYDLNQIPNDYTVEVRKRFKGLDLRESLMNYGWRFVTLYRRQGSRPSPWKRNVKRQNGCLRGPYK